MWSPKKNLRECHGYPARYVTIFTVQFAVESLSTLLWNQCPVCRGLAVQFGVEYALLALMYAKQKFSCLCEHRPEQLKLTFALWTRQAVALLIEQEYGLSLPIRTVGEYLKRWGFTPQRPMVRAYEQKSEAVKAWLDEEYPKIAARAKLENAEIHWGDETALVNTDVRGRGYQPKGQTPIAFAVGGSRQKLSMISTVTNQGKTRWMIVEENFDTDKFIEFLGALIKDAPQKVFLIVDNLRVHHSKLVKARAEEHKAQIELFYLPSYSPELNPDERLNADLKYAVGSKVAVRTKAKLKEATNEHMMMLSAAPERVKSYFQDKRIKYAA